ncbi:MAG: amidohydrolase family protein, partial [Holophagales bacterium]|nr:amidohydrolase family protein [Holophagales bacterium]
MSSEPAVAKVPGMDGTGTKAVASSRVLTPSGLRAAALVIENGLIAAVRDRRGLPADLPVDDLGDRVVMPGLVDGHVHINEPGREDWEGFAHATRAAAAGGITTLGDMPLNCRPVTATIEALEAKRWSTAGKLHVDVGFHGGLLPGYQDQIEPLVDGGVLAMKAFLVDPGIGDFRPVSATDLESAMPVLARRGIPLMVHAELVPKGAARSSRGADPRSYAAYRASRPSRWEVDAIELMIRLCRQTGCRVHIVHLATSYALGTLKSARAEGLPITVETCPHYLTFAAEQIADG